MVSEQEEFELEGFLDEQTLYIVDCLKYAIEERGIHYDNITKAINEA